jgi:hypothetical protein
MSLLRRERCFFFGVLHVTAFFRAAVDAGPSLLSEVEAGLAFSIFGCR